MLDDTVDLLVVGAGPAGLAAAVDATALGLHVTVLDEQPAPGGQIWRNLETRSADRRGADREGADLIARVRGGATRLQMRTTVLDVALDETGATVTWMGPDRVGRTRARAMVLATGAMERPLPFPGWTLPGVLGVGALQTALKTGGLVPGPADGGLVIAGRGPLVLLYLAQLAAAGGHPAAVLEFGPAGRSPAAVVRAGALALMADPLTVGRGAVLLARRALSGVPVRRGVRALAAEGDGRVQAVRFVDAAGEHVLPCAVLAVHDGVIPNTQTTRLLRLDHAWQETSRCFVPVTDDLGRASRPGVWVAGDGGGIEGAQAAVIAGRLAALDVARSSGRVAAEAVRDTIAALLRRRAAIRAGRRFLDALDPPFDPIPGLTDDTVVCRCEEVTAGTLRRAIASGAAGPNRAKTATRCGMGACQGRMCGPILTRLVAHATGRPAADTGALRIRPPLKPVPMAALAALAAGGDPLDPEEM